MKSCEEKSGVTLIEMLVAVAVISILVSLVLAGATRLHNQGSEQLMESTFSILDGALQEYYDYKGVFPGGAYGDPDATQLLYQELETVPGSRQVLEKVSRRLLRSGAGGEAPKVYDPWGTPVYYGYVRGDNFPLLESAGPDRDFAAAADNIRNR